MEMTDYRASLQEYLKNRMQALAPNLTTVVGELVGARLICHAGSLVNLAKCPSFNCTNFRCLKSFIQGH